MFDVFGSCFGVGILCGNLSALACLRRCIGSMGLSKTAIMRMPRVLESTNRDRQRERECLTRSDVWSRVPRASFPLGHFWLPNPISVKAFVHVHPFFPLLRLSTEAAYAESEMFGLMLLRDRLQEVTWQRKCHGNGKASGLSVKAWRGKRELVRFMSDVGR